MATRTWGGPALQSGFTCLPFYKIEEQGPQNASNFLPGQWSCTNLPNGYTQLTSIGSVGGAYNYVLWGKTINEEVKSPSIVTYNDPATFGGQTTPTTAWLSPAQDDSWEPRYVTPTTYQQTTQVPTQQAPTQTHLICKDTNNIPGVWRIAYVIDDNNFVVYDPQRNLIGTQAEETLYTLNVNVMACREMEVTIYDTATYSVSTVFNQGSHTLGPGVHKFTANKEGVIEPIVFWDPQSSGGLTAIMQY